MNSICLNYPTGEKVVFDSDDVCYYDFIMKKGFADPTWTKMVTINFKATTHRILVGNEMVDELIKELTLKGIYK